MAKSRSLVVVESPTKVKTIQKYLDSGFVVKASMGHIRDLPKSKLGVNEKKGFKPEYRCGFLGIRCVTDAPPSATTTPARRPENLVSDAQKP